MQLILYQLFSIDYPNEVDPFEAAILVGYTLIPTIMFLQCSWEEIVRRSNRRTKGREKEGRKGEEKGSDILFLFKSLLYSRHHLITTLK